MEAKIVLSDDLLSLAARLNAQKGGRSKSPKKMAAMRKNLKKAWQKRRKAA
jgi:hypothetical protein